MSAAVTPRTDESVLESLDFEHEVPCEAGGCHAVYGTGPAVYLIEQLPFPCGCWEHEETRHTTCLGCWDSAGRLGNHCVRCGAPTTRDEVFRIVRVIGGDR